MPFSSPSELQAFPVFPAMRPHPVRWGAVGNAIHKIPEKGRIAACCMLSTHMNIIAVCQVMQTAHARGRGREQVTRERRGVEEREEGRRGMITRSSAKN
jgi:hypothetical protein